MDNINMPPNNTIYKKVLLTEKEIPRAQQSIDEGWELSKIRPLTELERKIIINKVNDISKKWYANFIEKRVCSDEDLLIAADAAICGLKNGMLFLKNPTKDNYECLIELVKQTECWSILPYLFNDGDCYTNTNWLLMSYERLYKYMPEDVRYDVGTCVYIKAGFDFPTYLIRDLQNIRPSNYIANLPNDLRSQEYLTVYRASATEPDKIKQRIHIDYPTGREISWTLSPTIALQLYDIKMIANGKCFLYSGLIKPNDIIYFDDVESEILQLGSVTDVKQIPLNEMVDMGINESVQWTNDLAKRIT